MHAAVAPSQPAVLSLWVVARWGSVSDYMTGCEKGKPTTKSALKAHAAGVAGGREGGGLQQ